MFRMTVEGQFSAAHAIRNYDGPCARLHGHNYRIVAHLSGNELDSLGMLVDYTEVKRALAEVLEPLDHANLNDLPAFTTMNPTSEQIAHHLYNELLKALLITDDLKRRVHLDEVIVFESDRQGVGYGE